MDNTIRVFSGRTISTEDIEMIIWVRRRYPKLSRTELAATVCEIIGWTTPAGTPKTQQCKALLGALEEEGIITLPPVRKLQRRNGLDKTPIIEFDTTEILGEIRDYEPIRLEIAKPGEEQQRWRSYVNQYHMLGYKRTFGSRLQYFVKSGNKELGCMQFSASAWALEERDRWIGWSKEDRKARLNLIVNNSRTLIFPWVHIRNLASKMLSIVAKRIQDDWLTHYCYAPVMLETFVDTEHFQGVSYKAANWIYLGETQGRGRMDRKNEYALSRKAIFVYPLQKDFKECLSGEKPYKVVELQ